MLHVPNGLSVEQWALLRNHSYGQLVTQKFWLIVTTCMATTVSTQMS
jgi:hypothetical protein